MIDGAHRRPVAREFPSAGYNYSSTLAELKHDWQVTLSIAAINNGNELCFALILENKRRTNGSANSEIRV